MANTGPTAFGNTGLQKVVLDTTGAVILQNSFGTSRIGSWRLQVVPGGATPGSFTIKERLSGSALTGANWLTCIFYDDSTTTVQSAGTSVTAAKILTVVADGADIELDYTSGADGMTVYARPLLG